MCFNVRPLVNRSSDSVLESHALLCSETRPRGRKGSMGFPAATPPVYVNARASTSSRTMLSQWGNRPINRRPFIRRTTYRINVPKYS